MGCGASSPAPQPTAAPEPTKPKPAEPALASAPEPYVLAMATSRAKFVASCYFGSLSSPATQQAAAPGAHAHITAAL